MRVRVDRDLDRQFSIDSASYFAYPGTTYHEDLPLILMLLALPVEWNWDIMLLQLRTDLRMNPTQSHSWTLYVFLLLGRSSRTT